MVTRTMEVHKYIFGEIDMETKTVNVTGEETRFKAMGPRQIIKLENEIGGKIVEHTVETVRVGMSEEEFYHYGKRLEDDG